MKVKHFYQIFLQIYHTVKHTFRKIPILGKHTRRITCGAWSQQNLLALGSQDNSITISNSEGDTIRQTTLRNEPADISFSEMKGDKRSTLGENTVSVLADGFLLYHSGIFMRSFGSILLCSKFIYSYVQ